MLRISIAVALLVTSLGAADAAGERKRQKIVRPAPIAVPLVSQGMGTPRPVWATPGECYSDDGYGRYWPCGAGKE